MKKVIDLIMKNPLIPIFSMFLILHLVFLNINAAEWGDSYRILRASQYIQNLDYPADEKRPPLFSALLALRPERTDPILWGRLFMFALSLASFVLFNELAKLYLTQRSSRMIALILFTLNPVFFYWSLRIYADVLFAFIAMLSFYFLKKWDGKLSAGKIVVLGFIAALAVLTRFEGYILLGSIGLGLLLQKNWKAAVFYGLSALLFLFPYLLYRNPLTSSYLEEPGGRTYDIVMLLTYLASLLFIFGFTAAFAFIGKAYKKVWVFFRENLPLGIFISMELLLIMAWPAAVPRLFVAILPFLTLILGFSIRDFTTGTLSREEKRVFLASTVLFLGLYAILQYFLKLQFLIVLRPVFALILLVQAAMAVFLYFDKIKAFFALTLVSMTIWTAGTVWVHKDIYKSIKEASEYAYQNLDGDVYYNDIHSVSDWYLNELDPNDGVEGFYCSIESSEDCLEAPNYSDDQKDYFIITNEHDPFLTEEIASYKGFKQLKKFSYTIGRTQFFSIVVEATESD
jgi:hypothetical protein